MAKNEVEHDSSPMAQNDRLEQTVGEDALIRPSEFKHLYKLDGNVKFRRGGFPSPPEQGWILRKPNDAAQFL